ncbi:unnamed protein product [Darwinula stevensoni]|uniref:Apple domain-containing protein n=1 Tax=Darwinula stevensoni TaxID=69355 RepID=A0A7R9FNJ8_9CRUS|nr:unnamed protein product [Darwinula stevensoni]CAG0896545.1 unnamed protein product [Darwinula stevensoni]
MKTAMGCFSTLAALSCLFWVGSAIKPVVHWAVHRGQQYAAASKEIITDFEECESACSMDDPSLPCHAFNYREWDGTCQLVYEGMGLLVDAGGFQAFVKFLCLPDDRRMSKGVFRGLDRDDPSPEGWKGDLRMLKKVHHHTAQGEGGEEQAEVLVQVEEEVQGLEEGVVELEEGWVELEEGWVELEEGWVELEDDIDTNGITSYFDFKEIILTITIG